MMLKLINKQHKKGNSFENDVTIQISLYEYHQITLRNIKRYERDLLV